MTFDSELESILLKEYKDSRKMADLALENRDYHTAAKMFIKAAESARKLAGMARSPTLKKKRELLAVALLKVGSNLQRGILPEKLPKQISLGKSELESADEFEKYIEQTVISDSTVTWDDIGGLEGVKRLIKETIVLSAISGKPNAIKPWKGILLFGPPGTGKTLLAAATAGSLDATFFNVKVGQILSKYYGESPKLISALFNLARKKEPSIVFLDEFDSLALTRSTDLHEASRRTLSALLSEMDGFKNKYSNEFTLTLAATNTPWDLDEAVLARFPQRIYVPLPDKVGCKEIINIQTVNAGIALRDVHLDELAEKCVKKFYSGREISYLCAEAIWNMVREQNPGLDKLANLPLEEIKKRSLKIRPLTKNDFEYALERVESPLKERQLAKYNEWSKNYGTTLGG